MCRECERCRTISVSLEFKDCSWYHDCDLERLERAPNGAIDAFRSGPPLPASSAGSNTSLPTWALASGRARRDELRQRKLRLPWVKPHGTMDVAVVLFGKLGTFDLPASRMAVERGVAVSTSPAVGDTSGVAPSRRSTDWYIPSTDEPLPPSSSADGGGNSASSSSATQRAVVREAHASFVRHVVHPNPHVRLTVFAHSWNPSLGRVIDHLYQPAESTHDPERSHVCREGTCAKSALASLRWAIGAKRRHEKRRGRDFELAMLCRYDLAFHSPLRWDALRKGQVWVLAQCCPWQGSPVGVPSLPAGMARARSIASVACLGEAQGEPMDYCRVSKLQPRLAAAEAEYNYIVNDWLVVAPSATLDTFRQLLPTYQKYDAALGEVGVRRRWLHFLWAAHIHDALGASDGLMPIPTHVSLIRKAQFEGCYTNTSVEALLPTPAEPLYASTARLCPWRGRVRCHYHSKKCPLLRDSPVLA